MIILRNLGIFPEAVSPKSPFIILHLLIQSEPTQVSHKKIEVKAESKKGTNDLNSALLIPTGGVGAGGTNSGMRVLIVDDSMTILRVTARYNTVVILFYYLSSHIVEAFFVSLLTLSRELSFFKFP